MTARETDVFCCPESGFREGEKVFSANTTCRVEIYAETEHDLERPKKKPVILQPNTDGFWAIFIQKKDV